VSGARARTLLALAPTWLLACVGTETGNPSAEGTLAYNAYTSDASVVALQVAQGDAPVVKAAWLVLGDVSFVPRAECDPEADAPVHAHGIGAGDHATGEGVETPLAIDADTYCGVRFPLQRAAQATGNAPSALAQHSALIEGDLPDGTRFSVRSALEEELFLSSTSGFELGASAQVLIGFDVATWLADVDFGAVPPDADGVRVIDATHPDLLTSFESKLLAGTGLFLDPRGDHMVDPGVELAHGE
jgi:hypothetical protein